MCQPFPFPQFSSGGLWSSCCSFFRQSVCPGRLSYVSVSISKRAVLTISILCYAAVLSGSVSDKKSLRRPSGEFNRLGNGYKLKVWETTPLLICFPTGQPPGHRHQRVSKNYSCIPGILLRTFLGNKNLPQPTLFLSGPNNRQFSIVLRPDIHLNFTSPPDIHN